MTRLKTLLLSSFLATGLALPAVAQDVEPTADTAVTDSLQTVLASVYRGNPRLLAERARLREIDENYIQARAQGRMTMSAGGDVTFQAIRTPSSEGGFFGPQEGGWTDSVPRTAQLSLIQPLYQGGRVKALKRQSEVGIMAARAGLENAENETFLSAASAYVDILRDEEAARIRRNNVRVLTRQLTAANDRFEVGEGTRTDIAQSESRLAAAEAGLAQADAQLEVSRALFVRLVGRMPNQLAPAPDFVLPETLDDATRLARDNNPQLLAAYYNELAGDAAIDVAKAASRPTVALQGAVSSSRGSFLGFQDQDQATIGAQLSVPIFSGGANASRVRQAKNAKTRLAFETRDAERAVDQTVAQVWAQMDAARRIVETSRRQVASAEVAFEGVSLEQQVGTRTQLDVLDAEQETLNARLNLINAERDYDVAVFQLLSTIGVMDADGIDLPIETYDPDAYLSNVVYDGYKKAVDRFVPEAVQKIGQQTPNLITDPVKATLATADALELDEAAEVAGDVPGTIGQALKEGVDLVTFQTPRYDPRITDPEIEIVTEPYPDADATRPEPEQQLPIEMDEQPDPQIDEGAQPVEKVQFPDDSVTQSDD